jgi:hypothetical protein
MGWLLSTWAKILPTVCKGSSGGSEARAADCLCAQLCDGFILIRVLLPGLLPTAPLPSSLAPIDVQPTDEVAERRRLRLQCQFVDIASTCLAAHIPNAIDSDEQRFAIGRAQEHRPVWGVECLMVARLLVRLIILEGRRVVEPQIVWSVSFAEFRFGVTD